MIRKLKRFFSKGEDQGLEKAGDLKQGSEGKILQKIKDHVERGIRSYIDKGRKVCSSLKEYAGEMVMGSGLVGTSILSAVLCPPLAPISLGTGVVGAALTLYVANDHRRVRISTEEVSRKTQSSYEAREPVSPTPKTGSFRLYREIEVYDTNGKLIRSQRDFMQGEEFRRENRNVTKEVYIQTPEGLKRLYSEIRFF